MRAKVLGDPGAFFSRYMSDDSDDSTLAVLKDCRPGLRALLYLARCDGVFHPAEFQVMRNYVAAVANGRHYNWALFETYLAKQHPEKGLAKTSLKVFWHHANERKLLLDSARILSEADGVVVPEEIEGLHKIEALLNDHEDSESLPELSAHKSVGSRIMPSADSVSHSIST